MNNLVPILACKPRSVAFELSRQRLIDRQHQRLIENLYLNLFHQVSLTPLKFVFIAISLISLVKAVTSSWIAILSDELNVLLPA